MREDETESDDREKWRLWERDEKIENNKKEKENQQMIRREARFLRRALS
jgi:hypothetical protein